MFTFIFYIITSKGILAWVGLGSRSAYQVEFRFVARILGTFVRGCVPKKGDTVYLLPGAVPALSSFHSRRKYQKRMKTIEGLSKVSEYAALEKHITWAVSYLKDESRSTLFHFADLYRELCNRVFPTAPWLLHSEG
jgi:hypothetical protein